MRSFFKHLARFFASPRVAIALLAYVGVLALLGTLIPQVGIGIDSPFSLLLAWGPVASFVSALGLSELFSSPFFLGGTLLLFMSTCVCTLQRIRVARSRQQLCDRLRDGSTDKRGDDSAHDAEGSEESGRLSCEEQRLSTEGLRQLGFTTVNSTDTHVVGSASLWALYASPAFHILLVVLIAVVLAGRLTRSEASMVLPLGQSREVSEHYLDVEHQGLLYRFGSSPFRILALGIEQSYEQDGQARGMATELAIQTDTGRIAKRQMVFVNRPLAYGSTLIHIADQGIGLKFTVVQRPGATGRTSTVLTEQSEASDTLTVENAHEMFSPVRIATEDESAPFVIFRLLPNVVDGQIVPGSKDQAYGVIALADADMNVVSSFEELRVGQSMQLPGGGTIRLESVDVAVLLKIVDDWSVPVLYALSALATVALTAALLFCPRICAIQRDGRTGELTFTTRIFRPWALDAKTVEENLRLALVSEV